ncbi:MAG: S-adenosylmethionine:tRNA ribosyltransferase-isomerase [Ginsengibacter sp.]
MNPKHLAIADFIYHLPANKIAVHPLPERDQSKLLIYKNEEIKSDIYKNLANYISENSLLIFNNTKVIQARILFTKSSGGVIEFFCLEPVELNNDFALVMNKTKRVQWKCMIGGAGKWKGGQLEKKIYIEEIEVNLKVELKKKITDSYVAEFSWYPAYFTFAEVIEKAGEIPLPPYIKRKINEEDKDRYQTIYANQHGSVAAPTAGLHFTEAVFSSLKNKEIKTDFITLHVGAGTFKPVKATMLADHQMHAEYMEITITIIENILSNPERNIIAAGTTSARTLESIYWMGVKTFLRPDIDEEDLSIKQWEVYEFPLAQQSVDIKTALQSLINRIKKNSKEKLFIKTQIIITPGYQFRIIKALITNFHQPGSTLLLLIAAAAGDNWKKIYDYALENDFRFLSYGDGCIIYLNSPSIS